MKARAGAESNVVYGQGSQDTDQSLSETRADIKISLPVSFIYMAVFNGSENQGFAFGLPHDLIFRPAAAWGGKQNSGFQISHTRHHHSPLELLGKSLSLSQPQFTNLQNGHSAHLSDEPSQDEKCHGR